MVKVYEKKIIELIGLKTYKALLYLYPSEYNSIYGVGYPENYYITQVQAVINNSNLSGAQIRNYLEQAVTTGEINPGIKPLIGSSPVPSEYEGSFISNAYWFLIIFIVILFLLVIIIKVVQDPDIINVPKYKKKPIF